MRKTGRGTANDYNGQGEHRREYPAHNQAKAVPKPAEPIYIYKEEIHNEINPQKRDRRVRKQEKSIRCANEVAKSNAK